MKKYLYIVTLISLLCLSGCKDFLSEPVYTKPTSDYLTSTPDGLSSTILAMYYKDRELLRNNDDSESILYLALLMGDDVTIPRAGEGVPQFGRFNNLLPTNKLVGWYWRMNYAMIGYANLVIEGGKKLDINDPIVSQAMAEAYAFRAHAYLRLIQRFDHIYVTLYPTTPENVNDPVVYVPAEPDSVYNLIYSDLNKAIKVLPITTSQPGRFTQGAARHILAKAAAHHGDWQMVVNQVDSIEHLGVYHLLTDPSDVFNTGDLNHAEAIFVSQWSKATGGWYTNNNVNPVTNNGHRLSLHFTPQYTQEAGMMMDFASGGYPWGRLFPNNHLLSLYDQSCDKRYTAYYKHSWTYNNAAALPRGRHLGDTIRPTNEAQWLHVHPMCTKYTDSYTVSSPQETQSFKDVIIYRLAETYLLAAEAYWHIGNQTKAREYFNKTYTRAGNKEWTADLTLDDILDEHARELAMEGDRWLMLKRENKLVDNVRRWGGEFVKKDNGDVLFSDTAIRINVDEHYMRWPIPQSQINIMGASFPQNPGY